jgi:protein ImuA
MGHPAPTLDRLRQTLAGVDPSLRPALPGGGREVGLGAGLDSALGGGLACGSLHELAPSGPVHLAAATGFAMALACLANRDRGETLWIVTDFAAREGGSPYGPGLDLFGQDAARLLVLRVPRAVDALWAMEEALRCGALGSVVTELSGEGDDADLTATRRLSLAAREGQGTALGLLLRQGASALPSAAVTRWHVAAAPSEPDRFGGLGAPRFDLSLVKNRRGPCGRWTVTWDRHHHVLQRHVFQPAVSVGVAAAAFDRPDRTQLRHTGS